MATKAAQWTHCDLNHRAAQCTYNLVKGNGKGGDHMTGVKGVRLAQCTGKKGQHEETRQNRNGLYQSYV